jgi:hypothetical protein
MPLGENPHPGSESGPYVQDDVAVGNQALGQVPSGAVATYHCPTSLLSAPGKTLHVPITIVRVGKLGLVHR